MALVLFAVVLLLVLGQGWLVLGFVRALRTKRPPLLTDAQAPRAAVILCLRGGDPFLTDCLHSLLGQDYPDFDVRVIVDHPDDPAHRIALHEIQRHKASNVSLEFLKERRDSCSLKCSSLLQVVGSLDDSYQFVAQLDADVVAHPTWLRELATALADEKVGAATGNRWYMPANPSVGALVRYTWNAAAAVQMYWYRVAWGGTLAVKTRVFRETDVLEKWSKAFCEDTMLYSVLKKMGLRIAFVPSLMMINREDCRLGDFFRWVRRQLLTTRLYHPAWPAVVGHGILSTLAPLAALVVAVVALFTGHQAAAMWAVIALAVYELSVAALLVPMELAVQRIAETRGEDSNWLTLADKLKCLAIMPVTQLVYPVALAAAAVARSTVWRGIAYQIKGPQQIEMEQYAPFQPIQSPERRESL